MLARESQTLFALENKLVPLERKVARAKDLSTAASASS
jgi:hypothetical protein